MLNTCLLYTSSLVSGITGAGIPVGSTASSVDGKAMLAFVMLQRYANNEELAKRYPEVYADINLSLIHIQMCIRDRYKNYIVTNKYIRNSDTYVLELMNPFSKKTEEVYIKDYLYDNTYFVGDTIK